MNTETFPGWRRVSLTAERRCLAAGYRRRTRGDRAPRHADDQRGTIDAYEELRQFGHFDRAGLLLLRSLMRQETQRFPVLEPPAGWTDESVMEMVQSYFAEKGPRITAALLAQAQDTGSMARILRRSIKNFLIDQARQTPSGAVRRKIEDLLTAGPDFAQVPPSRPGAGRWHLAGGSDIPWGGDLHPLVEAAYAVPDVRAVRWSGRRRAPLASDASLTAILRAILTAAGGSLEVAQLTAVLLRRFPAAAEPADATLTEELYDRAVAPVEDRPDVIAEISQQAREVYEQLSPAQRALLPHLNKPPEEHQQILGVGRSQAYATTRRLRALLTELLDTEEHREEIGLEVLCLCLINP